MSPYARQGSLAAFSLLVPNQNERPRIAKMHLFGAFMFVLGSAFFVYEEIAPQWLLFYRIGCVIFIVGCFAYLLALITCMSSSEYALSNKISDVAVALGMTLFIVGCGLAFGGEEKFVLQHLNAMNWMFLVGSLLLFADAVKCSVTAQFMDGVSMGNYLDIGASLCFVIGAIFAGKFYKETPFWVMEGMLFWLLGSCVCVVGPARAACKIHDVPPLAPLLAKSVKGGIYGSAQPDGRPDSRRSSGAVRVGSLPPDFHRTMALNVSDGASEDWEDDGVERAFPPHRPL